MAVMQDYLDIIKDMRFFDPHIHMTSRTTDDYQAMARAGVVAVLEPAFWLGQPRTGVDSFRDYYSSLVGWERFRASQFGIKHYCTIGLNSKEANNEALAEQVMEILPLFIYKEGVVGVGEIGFDDQTAAEEKYYRAQLALSKEANLPVQIHTPHRDKKNGTLRSMEIAVEHGCDPGMVIVDHNNEETVRDVLDRGFWAGFTIYPFTKMGNERMCEIVKQFGSDHIMINSAADWGISDPLAVPKTAALMKQRGISDEDIRMVTYQNALTAFGQSGQIDESDFSQVKQVDQSQKYEGSSILRGGQKPGAGTDSLIIE
jgi:predicted metal-dependent TIM-barrel fold hydrolase